VLVLLTHPLNVADFRDISGQDRPTSAPSASLQTPHHYASRPLTVRAMSPSFLSGVGVFREPDCPPLPADVPLVSRRPWRRRSPTVFAMLSRGRCPSVPLGKRCLPYGGPEGSLWAGPSSPPYAEGSRARFARRSPPPVVATDCASPRRDASPCAIWLWLSPDGADRRYPDFVGIFVHGLASQLARQQLRDSSPDPSSRNCPSLGALAPARGRTAPNVSLDSRCPV